MPFPPKMQRFACIRLETMRTGKRFGRLLGRDSSLSPSGPIADERQLDGFHAARQVMLMNYAARTLPTGEVAKYLDQVFPWIEKYLQRLRIAMRFTNRRQAGLVLADHISAHQPIDPLILALPRGGVPVGYQVAASLRCDLDVLVVRKIGVPHQPELAMGAVSEGEVVVRNDRIVDASRIVEATFESLVESARHQLRDKLKMYREGACTYRSVGSFVCDCGRWVSDWLKCEGCDKGPS